MTNSVYGITVTSTVLDSMATVTVNGQAVSSGEASEAIALIVGDNTVTVEVTAEDGTTKACTLTVKREPAPPMHIVTYDGNVSTGGSVPEDQSNPYEEGISVTVLGNPGNLVREGYTFADWNTEADGSGMGYAAGAKFMMGSANVTLYAQWTIKQYTVSHSDHAAEPTAPTRTDYTFVGWYMDEEFNNALTSVPQSQEI